MLKAGTAVAAGVKQIGKAFAPDKGLAERAMHLREGGRMIAGAPQHLGETGERLATAQQEIHAKMDSLKSNWNLVTDEVHHAKTTLLTMGQDVADTVGNVKEELKNGYHEVLHIIGDHRQPLALA